MGNPCGPEDRGLELPDPGLIFDELNHSLNVINGHRPDSLFSRIDVTENVLAGSRVRVFRSP